MAESATTWLSRDATELAQRLATDTDEAADCDVLVVGSGYGGAVAAARMAGLHLHGAGTPARVWVVERGLEHLPGSFARRFSELPGHVRYSQQDGRAARGQAEGLFDLRLGDQVNVLLANGLGGGSLINAGVMARPRDTVFDTGWPAPITVAAMQDAYAAALAMLAPEPAPALPKFAALDALAAAHGLRAQQAQVTIAMAPQVATAATPALAACTRCGDCLTGCNQGAKRSLDTSYLAQARHRGAELFCGVTVLCIEPPMAPGAPWQVQWQFTNPALRESPVQRWVLRTRHVVLAAGALGSTEILLKSRSGRLQLSDCLGRQFSTNGDMLAAVHGQQADVQAVADQETDPASAPGRQVGPTITGLVHGTQDGQAIVAEEFAVPGALRQVFGEALATFGFANIDATLADGFAVSGRLLSSSSLYGLMGDDGAAGTLTLALPGAGDGEQPGDGQVCVQWPAPGVGRVPVFDAQIAWLQRAVSPDAKQHYKVVPNPLWRNVFDQVAVPPVQPRGGIVTVHPLGGCPMADSADQGVVDALGRVFNPQGRRGAVHPGLVVLDGAIVPRALGINPALTITALAEHAVAGLCADWGLGPPAQQPAARADLPPRRLRPARSTPALAATAVLLSERLDGPLVIAGQPYWATLRINDVAIPDLRALTHGGNQAFAASSATLTLWPNAGGGDEFSDWRLADRGWQFDLAASVQFFVPSGSAPKATRQLVYTLQVEAARPPSAPGCAAGEPPLAVGTRLQGLKHLGAGLQLPTPADGMPRKLRGLWRQLTELELGPEPCSAANRHGLLRLAYDDLAQRRSPLLAVQKQSSAPDQLADLAGLGLLVLRQALKLGYPHLKAPDDYPQAQILRNLANRWPGPVNGCPPEVVRVGRHGARLSHYTPECVPPDGPLPAPVLLIHGYGASGNTFTHDAIPVSLVSHLLRHGRHAWVLDLRSSIAHESDDPDAPRPGPWPFDEIAVEDIPDALRCVAGRSGGPVHVVAHCIGSAMFCVAMLEHAEAHRWVRSAVLSQTGPVMRFSPLNRLRGQLAAYLQQFMGLDELDNRPEYRRRRQPDGTVAWVLDEDRAARLRLLDALLASYPYPDDDEDGVERRTGVPFKRVRRRADIIFGHLMELQNLAPSTLGCFDAINGWVKVRSFAQTIHYVNQGLLTDRSGNGQALTHDRLRERMGFPLLVLHGRRNRVFDWRGSLDTLHLLRRVRGLDDAPPVDNACDGSYTSWGDATLKLVRLNGYGHQDCLVGKDAATDVFGHLTDFLDQRDRAVPAAGAAPAAADQGTPVVEVARPWLGPVWGDLRRDSAQSGWRLRLVAHPAPQRARSAGWVLVPVQSDAAGTRARWDLAMGVLPGDDVPDSAQAPAALDPAALAFPPGPGTDADALPGITQRALQLALAPGCHHFLVLMAHTDLPLADLLQPAQQAVGLLGANVGMALFSAPLHAASALSAAVQLPSAVALAAPGLHAAVPPVPWVVPGRPLRPVAMDALLRWRDRMLAMGLDPLDHAQVQLSPAVRDAGVTRQADGAAPARQPLCLALTSCQYPPGLLDEDCAQASLARLRQRLDEGTPPQLLLALGDQVYMDATAGLFDGAAHLAVPEARARAAYALNWRMPAFRQVTARLPVYSLMDDHEVRDGWQPHPRVPGTPDEAAALRLHWQLQASLNPEPWTRDAPHYSFQPGGALVVMLDTRRERAPRRIGSTVPGIDLARAQIARPASLRHAMRLLAQAPADTAKFLVSAAPLLPLRKSVVGHPAQRLRADGWDGYPQSMLEVLQCVVRQNIQRLVLLAGDAHLSAACRLRLGAGPTVHAVISSGLHAPWPFANSDPDDYLLDGTGTFAHLGDSIDVVVEQAVCSVANGFATVALSGPPADPHARLAVELVPGNGDAPLRFTSSLVPDADGAPVDPQPPG